MVGKYEPCSECGAPREPGCAFVNDDLPFCRTCYFERLNDEKDRLESDEAAREES